MHAHNVNERAYGSALWDEATMYWNVGDWDALIGLPLEEIKQHPKMALLLLYIASAHFQLGNSKKGKEVIQELSEYNCKNAKILFSGLCCTLGRAKSLLDDVFEADKFFGYANVYGLPHINSEKIFHFRKSNQLEMIGLMPNDSFQLRRIRKQNIKILKEINLGEAWASNTINTVVFRHHAIFSCSGKQYTAFYVNPHELKVVERNLVDGKIKFYSLGGEYNLHDAHNSISLGIDRQGYIHLSYDHHGSRLKYRRSVKPYNIFSWTEEMPMTGIKEERVTYPTFILPQAGNPLFILYRDGTWKKGDIYLKHYDENSSKWVEHSLPVLSGALQRPWTSNAYWNNPAVGKDGSIHLSFTWRTDYLPGSDKLNNINIDYAKSYDCGYTWFTSKDRLYDLPVTQVNSETVWPVSPGSNLMNQCSMALDSKGYPHIAFYADDSNNIPQYQHLWFDGKKWKCSYVSRRRKAFSLSGGGTLNIPISRPVILIDKQDNVYFIHRDNEYGQGLSITFLPQPSYTFRPENAEVLLQRDIGFSEPLIDHTRWKNEGIISLFVQYSEQPDGDQDVNAKASNAFIIDIETEIFD